MYNVITRELTEMVREKQILFKTTQQTVKGMDFVEVC